MEHLKNMKSKLVDCIEKQINGNLEYTSSKELGEAVDMVKDLAEAIYYTTITEAMEGKDHYAPGGHYSSTHYYDEPYKRDRRGDLYDKPYWEPKYPIMYSDDRWDRGYDERRGYRPHDTSYPTHEDRSSHSRRRYMDGKMYNDKNAQMHELEVYTQELMTDITDMIKDASPEEKQLLQQKISMLASKIK